MDESAESIHTPTELYMPTCGEFLAKPCAKPDWIVENFIQKHSKGDLCGGSKTRKSLFALELALSIAAGRDFLDIYKIPSPRRVVYVDLELMEFSLRERLSDAIKGLGLAHEDIFKNLFITPLREHPFNIRENPDRFIERLQRDNCDLVILDPRYKLMLADEDENLGCGIRKFLDFRDKITKVCAVLVVTHDPKGDATEKKTTDSGAGSYYAGADFDFRISIDEASDNDSNETFSYVIEHEGRARAPLPTIGVRINQETQTFIHQEDFCTTKKTYQNRKQAAKKESDKDDVRKLTEEINGICETAGTSLLPMTTFKSKLYELHIVGQKRVDEFVKQCVEHGTLKMCSEYDANSNTGNKKHGVKFISTPEYIDDYLEKHEGAAK